MHSPPSFSSRSSHILCYHLIASFTLLSKLEIECNKIRFLFLQPPHSFKTPCNESLDCSSCLLMCVCVCVCVCVSVLNRFTCVRLFTTLWTVACQAPLSMGFSRKEDWSGQPFPSQGKLPNSAIKPMSLTSPALAGGFVTTSTYFN